MTSKTENLVDLIYYKLKKYEVKKISLEKENLKKFIYSLLKGNWIKREHHKDWYYGKIYVYDYV